MTDATAGVRGIPLSRYGLWIVGSYGGHGALPNILSVEAPYAAYENRWTLVAMRDFVQGLS